MGQVFKLAVINKDKPWTEYNRQYYIGKMDAYLDVLELIDRIRGTEQLHKEY